jgi:hypothetical protein
MQSETLQQGKSGRRGDRPLRGPYIWVAFNQGTNAACC